MGEIHTKMDTDWNAVSTSQETPRNAGTHLKLAERKGRNLPEELQREWSPADTLISDLGPPEQ